MTLKDLQKTFKDVVIKGDMSTPLPIQEKGLSMEARLSIYQRNIFSTLGEFLTLSYPKTHALLGTNTFKSLSQSFIQQHPPKAPNLDDFAFQFEPFIQRSLTPFMKAVTHFENALRSRLLADTVPDLDPKELEGKALEDPEGLGLCFHPSVLLQKTPYAFHTFWHTLESDPQEYPANDSFYLIHLEGIHAVFKPLELPEWIFLKTLESGETLGSALDNALNTAHGDNTPFDLAQKLPYYLKYMVFSKVR